MALHILQLGPYPPPVGGISRNMLAIRDEVLASGGKCLIIATSKSTNVSDEPDVYHPRSALQLIGLLRKLKYDVLHLHIGGDISGRILALALVCTFFGRKRSVLTLHSGAYPQTIEGRSAKPGSIRGFIFKRFSQIIAVSESIADVFRRYGVASERIKIIPPYSLSRPNETVTVPAVLADFRKRHSLLLLAVGGLERDYDPLFQVAAMKGILAEFPNAGLMIVGDGSMRDEVESTVAASGYADNIHLAGNVDHSVVLHLIAGADILLRTTLFDGDAISIREAMFLDTPVIATDTGERPEGVYLVSIHNAEALVGKIKVLAASKKKPSSKKNETRSNIISVLQLYNELLDNSRK